MRKKISPDVPGQLDPVVAEVIFNEPHSDEQRHLEKKADMEPPCIIFLVKYLLGEERRKVHERGTVSRVATQQQDLGTVILNVVLHFGEGLDR